VRVVADNAGFLLRGLLVTLQLTGLGFVGALLLGTVILPGAFRAMVQPLVNIFIGIALGSSPAAAVGVNELTNRTQVLNLQSAQAVLLFLVSGAVYLAIALLGGRWAGCWNAC
jgi:glutamate transport system permease protein